MTLEPNNPGYEIEFEKGAGNSKKVRVGDDSLRDGLEELIEDLMLEGRYNLLATNGHRQMRHAMSTGMLYIIKPSNVTQGTYKSLVAKLNFVMDSYPVNVRDFRKLCDRLLAKCALPHALWVELAVDFEKIIAGSDGASKALKGRITLPNLTSLKLILTVRDKIPGFPLDAMAIKCGEQAYIINMIAIATAHPFVMVASMLIRQNT